MRLIVLGSNGQYPTPGRPASGYLVIHGSTTLWLDAGSGTVGQFGKHSEGAELDGVVISHAHPDHCADLFALMNLLRFGPSRRSGLPLLAPPPVAERFAGFLDHRPGDDAFDVFDWCEVSPGDAVVVGGLTLRFGAAEHSVPAIVTRIEGGGRTLVYSGDTGPGGDLELLAADVDVLLCEATFQGDRADQPWPFHLTAAEAGALAERASVARLIVTHVAPSLDPAKSVLEAADAFGGQVDYAAPGMEVEI